MTLYLACKRAYRACVPSPVRHRLLDPSSAISKVTYPLKRVLERLARHDEIYDKNYYLHVETVMAASNEVIADSIVAAFDPRTVLDVGCGTGALIVALNRRGVDARGLEHSLAALAVCHGRGLDVKQFDLEHDTLADLRVDVVISTEVAEHLPAHVADRFIDALCACAPIVLMTAATPGQGGTDHVNEQPHEYWIEKFRDRGFVFNEDLSLDWRRDWEDARTATCYHRNVMVFEANEEAFDHLNAASKDAVAAAI